MNNTENKWKYISEREGDFPEAYMLAQDGHKIKVEVNRAKKQVKIFAETKSGEMLESSITNGVVIEEINGHTGKKENLLENFTELSKYLSAIPDGRLVRLIGGNYGVMSQYLGRISKYANEDIKLLKRIFASILGLPAAIFIGILTWTKGIIDEPKVSDVVDSAVIVTGGYLLYLVNFNYIFGGVALFVGALASGYIDWLVRKRDPYILKIIAISIPAFYAILIGFRYQ